MSGCAKARWESREKDPEERTYCDLFQEDVEKDVVRGEIFQNFGVTAYVDQDREGILRYRLISPKQEAVRSSAVFITIANACSCHSQDNLGQVVSGR